MTKSPTLAIRSSITLLALVFATHVCAQDSFPGKTWAKLDSPDAAGWSSEKLKIADDFARTLKTDSYLVVQHGKIVHEYGDTGKATNVYSVRKSVLSILVGMYADRGVFKLDPTMAELGINDKDGLSAQEQQATVRQLLEARSGVYHPAAYETPEMAAMRPARGRFKPGEHWSYNNWDFNTLGAIFQKMTGKSVFESLRDDLAAPLQFENFDYAADTHFDYAPASDYPAYIMRLSARDLARIGWLMVQNGKWQGRQLVSPEWIEISTTVYSRVGPGVGYGYLWWVGIDGWALQNHFPGEVFSARGNLGQYVLIVPDLDLVIVHKVDGEGNAEASSGGERNAVSGIQFGELLKRIMAARATDG